MLKNISKSGLKLDISRRGDTSSRSNSFRKINHAVQTGANQSMIQISVSSSAHQTDNQALFEPVTPTNAAEVSDGKARPSRHVYNHTVEDQDIIESIGDHSMLHASFSKEAQVPSQ